MSISAMMIMRLVVSNLFPFTSPVFAYLIAKSQPHGQEANGIIYLLLCSMPAGLVIPFLDFALYQCYFKKLEKDMQDEYESMELRFKFTNAASWITDRLPFSFWVRSFFMEPAFDTMKNKLHPTDETAASAALLAGHLMIWAGAPTTMYSRLFVPDAVTCCLIQPLGLT